MIAAAAVVLLNSIRSRCVIFAFTSTLVHCQLDLEYQSSIISVCPCQIAVIYISFLYPFSFLNSPFSLLLSFFSRTTYPILLLCSSSFLFLLFLFPSSYSSFIPIFYSDSCSIRVYIGIIRRSHCRSLRVPSPPVDCQGQRSLTASLSLSAHTP